MEKKTAMEELKQKVLTRRNEAHVNCFEDTKQAYNDVLNLIESLLPKEREQIEEAWKNGERDGYKNISASDYFTQTYGK